MPLPRPLAPWPRVTANLARWAETLTRLFDEKLVRGGPFGIVTVDSTRWQQVLAATTNPQQWRAPFEVGQQATGEPLVIMAFLTQSSGAVQIVPWHRTDPPPAGYWHLSRDGIGTQIAKFGTAPGAGTVPVYLLAVLS